MFPPPTPPSPPDDEAQGRASAFKQFKAYSTFHPLLHDVDSEAQRSIDEPAGFAYVLLYGPSGVGKTTLIHQLERRNGGVHMALSPYYPGGPLHLSPFSLIPTLLLETRPPDGATFNRTDYYHIALEKMGEYTYEQPTLIHISDGQTMAQKQGRGKATKFNDSKELRQVYEAALKRHGVRTIILDEAQHLLKLSSGVKIIDQLDWIKSMANTTGVLHILTGTYELLAFRGLNGQTARRGKEIHFPRYQFQVEPDQIAFQRALLTLLQQVPLRVDAERLLKEWPYFYERSIGCIGVLKDWLVRVVAAAAAAKLPELLFERIQTCALPLAQCESMALEAANGEQELHYSAARQQRLWALLGMDRGVETAKAVPVSHPLPDHTPRIGEQNPVRLPVGEPSPEKGSKNCPFSGERVEISHAQLAESGIEKLQCPLCGTNRKAQLRGDFVFFLTHGPLLIKRVSKVPRWVKQDSIWTLFQRG